MNLDELVDEFTSYVRTFLVKECGTKKNPTKRATTQKNPRSKFSRTYYRLRKRLRRLKSMLKTLRKKPHQNKTNIKRLYYQKRALLRSIARRKKAETKIWEAKQRLKTQRLFNKDHYSFCKHLFSKNSSGEPQFDKNTCENHFKQTYSDPLRGFKYTPPKGLT